MIFLKGRKVRHGHAGARINLLHPVWLDPRRLHPGRLARLRRQLSSLLRHREADQVWKVTRHLLNLLLKIQLFSFMCFLSWTQIKLIRTDNLGGGMAQR